MNTAILALCGASAAGLAWWANARRAERSRARNPAKWPPGLAWSKKVDYAKRYLRASGWRSLPPLPESNVQVRGAKNGIELNLFIADDNNLGLKTILRDALQASQKSTAILGVLTNHDLASEAASLPEGGRIFLISPKQLPDAEALVRNAQRLRDELAAAAGARAAQGAGNAADAAPENPAAVAEPISAPAMPDSAADTAARADRGAPPGPPPIRGFVEVINAAKILGWAFSPAFPDEALTIRAEADNGDVLETRADRFRDDLRRAGFGDGKHEFVISLAQAGAPQSPRSWTVFAETASGQRSELRGLSQARNPPKPAPETQPPGDHQPATSNPQAPAATVAGFVERATQTQVHGWTYCQDRPDEHLDVLVSWHGELVAQGKANRFREDLRRAQIGNGDHAFIVDVPAGSIGMSAENLAVMAISPSGALSKLAIYASAFEPAPGAAEAPGSPPQGQNAAGIGA